MAEKSPFSFALALGTRTALNFSAPIAVIGSAIWLLFGGLERYMQMTLIEMLRMHDTELVSRLLFVLKARGVEVTPEVADELHVVARQFLDEWQTELKDAKRE